MNEMINERTQRIFLLFYSGYNQQEIADDLGTFKSSVNVLLNTHATEWIRDKLLDTHKQRLLDLASNGLNTQKIADVLGKPWNRYSVQFTLRHLKVIMTMEGYNARTLSQSTAVIRATPHVFRCMRCGSHYRQTMAEAALNPDRLCPTTPEHYGCVERRQNERRGIKRVDPSG